MWKIFYESKKQKHKKETKETTLSTTDRLKRISNDVTELWNEVIVKVQHYAYDGKSSTGSALDIDFLVSTMDKYFDQLTEDKVFIDELGEEYSDLVLAFDNLYEEAVIIHTHLKEETPKASTKLAYEKDIDLFKQYHQYFYNSINEIAYGHK